MTDVRIATLLKFPSKIKWLTLQSSKCTWDVPETFLIFYEGRCSNMDTIHERKNTFTIYYASSILLKGWTERAGSWTKSKVLYKPKHNKTISQQSPESWLFAILFILFSVRTPLLVYIIQLKSMYLYNTHKTEF